MGGVDDLFVRVVTGTTQGIYCGERCLGFQAGVRSGSGKDPNHRKRVSPGESTECTNGDYPVQRTILVQAYKQGENRIQDSVCLYARIEWRQDAGARRREASA